MLDISCEIYWYIYIFVSALLIAGAVVLKFCDEKVGLLAFFGTSMFYILSAFRAADINRDTLSYLGYGAIAKATDFVCFLVGTRFEPLNSAVLWASANATGSPRAYLFIMAAAIVASNLVIFLYRPRAFLVFAALTFPQFAMVQGLATARWGVAVHVLAASLVVFYRTTFVWRAAGALLATALHFGAAVAGLATIFRPWWWRIGICALATIAAAVAFPSGTLESGSGLRYIIALVLSASLYFTVGVDPRKDEAYRDHLALVAASAIMSSLYLVSPHLTRFATILLFISYVPLLFAAEKSDLAKRLAVLTLCLVPLIVLGIEIRASSCTIWSDDTVSGASAGEVEVGKAYEGIMELKGSVIGSAGSGKCKSE